MVPVDRAAFYAALSPDPVVRALTGFLFDAATPRADMPGLSIRGQITVDALRALALGDRELFAKAYGEIRTRRISDDADWIYDDYLLFALCVGARRYSTDRDFLLQVLDQRRKVQGGPAERELIEEYVKLLDASAQCTGSPVLIVGRFLAGDLGHAAKDFIPAYRRAISALARTDTSEFLRIVSVKAVDVVVECSPVSVAVPSVFWQNFERRSRQVAFAIYGLLCLVVALVWCYLGAHYLFGSGTAANVAEKLFSMSLVLAPSAVLFARNRVVHSVQRILIRFWGGNELAGKLIPPAG